jgi:GNAT superfamily N-acetyltransferase
MTEQDGAAQRRVIADALNTALDRRHEVLEAIVGSADFDDAVDTVADLLATTPAAAEAVLGLSFHQLTAVARKRIAAELDDLATVAPPAPRQPERPGRLTLRPFAPERDRDIFAARTAEMRLAGDGTAAPAGDLADEIREAAARVAAEEAAWLVAEVGPEKIGMVFGELCGGEVDVRIWIHPDHRKRGYGTAALRTSRSELAAFFPAVPLVVRAPAAG